ncbi:MAG TPA: kinase [Phenylobacterium sp.]|nr:kinase [Phenylobacterium sp.]
MTPVDTGAIEALIAAEQLPPGFGETALRIHQPIAARIAERHGELARPILVGLCGPQGGGKSTAAAVLRILLQGRGLRMAALSIDDVYLTRAERADLARRVHPLLATRGPPGSHDIGLLDSVLRRLLGGESLALPSFDKATDDRRAPADWPWFDGPADIVLLEGWCVGAAPQPPAMLAEPVNALERDEDGDGVWRRFANEALAAYQPVFGRIDLLIQLRAPDFETVLRWRREQEAKLRLRVAGRPGLKVMTDDEVARFVQHYERLTRHVLSEMPARADVVVDLGPERELRG